MIYDFNEWTKHFFIKIYLSFYSRKEPTVSCCLRDRWRDIYSERGLLPISSPGSQGVPMPAPPCKLVRDNLIDCVSHSWLWFSALCPNLTAWFSLRVLLPVTHLLYLSALIMLPCLLVTMWQHVIAHRVTLNELKIHGIFYITHWTNNKLLIYTYNNFFNKSFRS